MNYYLGIFGGVGTNPSAALLKGKKLIAFAEEERFTRIKNAPLALPINSIFYCLKEGKITIDKIKKISFGWDCRTVSNGHSHIETYNAIKKTIKIKQKKPKMIIFNTKKGNRVPGLENAPLSHVTAIKSDLIDTLIKR